MMKKVRGLNVILPYNWMVDGRWILRNRKRGDEKKKKSSGVNKRGNGHLTPLSFPFVLLASVAIIFGCVCTSLLFSFHFTNGRWVFRSAHDCRMEMGKAGRGGVE